VEKRGRTLFQGTIPEFFLAGMRKNAQILVKVGQISGQTRNRNLRYTRQECWSLKCGVRQQSADSAIDILYLCFYVTIVCCITSQVPLCSNIFTYLVQYNDRKYARC